MAVWALRGWEAMLLGGGGGGGKGVWSRDLRTQHNSFSKMSRVSDACEGILVATRLSRLRGHTCSNETKQIARAYL